MGEEHSQRALTPRYQITTQLLGDLIGNVFEKAIVKSSLSTVGECSLVLYICILTSAGES
jgi:hypothetical protein